MNEKIPLQIIETPGPGKLGFWCQGSCGSGRICSDATFAHGYCLEPKARTKVVKESQ